MLPIAEITKNTSATDPVTDAPGVVSEEQLNELGIEVTKNESEEN